MNFFSSVAADLVEKRLWPVAAVLGAGAVAAPVAAHITAPQPASSAAPPAVLARKSPPAPAPDLSAVKSLLAQLAPNVGVIPLGHASFHDPFSSAGPSSTTTSTPASPAAAGVAPGGPASARGGSAPSTEGSSVGSGVQLTPVSIKPPSSLHRVVSPPSRPSPSRITPAPHVNSPRPGPTPISGPTSGSSPSAGSSPAPGSTPPAGSTSPSPTSPGNSGSPPSVWAPATSHAKAPAGGKAPAHANSPSRRTGSHDSLNVYSATIRFGQAASAVTYKDPVRLSPLPSKADPEVVYLGVMKGGKRAAFLVPKSATATGDGTCQPTPTHCQVVALRPGGTEFLDILTPTGLVQYELDLVRIDHHRTATQALAARLHRQESSDGRGILRQADATVLTELAFSPSDGTVYTRGKAVLAAPSSSVSTTRELPPPRKPPAPPAHPVSPPARPPAPAVVPVPATPPAAGSTPRRST